MANGSIAHAMANRHNPGLMAEAATPRYSGVPPFLHGSSRDYRRIQVNTTTLPVPVHVHLPDVLAPVYVPVLVPLLVGACE
jgi:hypothetical protein